jgi:hypothetical protein
VAAAVSVTASIAPSPIATAGGKRQRPGYSQQDRQDQMLGLHRHLSLQRHVSRQPAMIGMGRKRITSELSGELRAMKNEALIAGGIIVAGIAVAALTLDGETVPNKKLPGGTEVCTYRAGPMDAELIDKGGDAGQRILRSILALERKCEFVTLVLPDGTSQVMKLGKEGRKPGDKGPPSITVF